MLVKAKTFGSTPADAWNNNELPIPCLGYNLRWLALTQIVGNPFPKNLASVARHMGTVSGNVGNLTKNLGDY